jgi:hypothetical protein
MVQQSKPAASSEECVVHRRAIRLARFLVLVLAIALLFSGIRALALNLGLNFAFSYQSVILDALLSVTIAAVIAVPWRLLQRARRKHATNVPVYIAAIIYLGLEILFTRETLVDVGAIGGRPLLFFGAFSPCAWGGADAIESERQAVLAARRIWYCLNPELAPLDDQHWLDSHSAILRDDAWYVSEIIPFGYAGGGLNMELAQKNGRLLNLFMTQ